MVWSFSLSLFGVSYSAGVYSEVPILLTVGFLGLRVLTTFLGGCFISPSSGNYENWNLDPPPTGTSSNPPVDWDWVGSGLSYGEIADSNRLLSLLMTGC